MSEKKMMKSLAVLSSAFLLSAGTGATLMQETVLADTGDIVILYTNDVHCGVEDNIGYTGLAAYKKEVQAAGNQVLLVDAGDAIQGGAIGILSKGEYPIEIMNAIGYDVAVMGNHEFDYGMDRFLELAEMADFPYICCNFVDSSTGQSVFDGYKLFEVGEKTVAFVGITTPKTITSSTPIYFQDDSGNFIYDFCQDATGEKLYQKVQDTVDEARTQGADYVIALAHLGIEASTSPWMSTEVIANTTGIDAVIDGHSHSEVEQEKVKNKEGKEVLLTQTGTKLSAIGQLTIDETGNVSSELIKEYETKDADMEKTIQNINNRFSEQLNEVIGSCTVDLIDYDPEQTDVRVIRNAETNLGDFCADAYREAGQADIGIANGGGIRAGIAAGEVTYGGLLAVNPYGNALTVIEATGQQIKDALELSVSALPEEQGGFQQVSGLTFEIDMNTDSHVQKDDNGMFLSVDGDYRVKNIKVNGEELVLDQTYTVAGVNYTLCNGGDGFTMFDGNTVVKDSFAVDVETLIDYVENNLGGTIGEGYEEAYGDGRITAIE